MKSIKEQLDKLGQEYKLEMNKDKDEYFVNLFMSLVKIFKCEKEISKTQEVFPIIDFIKAFYEAGFYKGLNYGIDSAEHVVIDDNDMMLKYSDEINKEILKETNADFYD